MSPKDWSKVIGASTVRPEDKLTVTRRRSGSRGVTVSARPNYTWKAKTSAKHLIRNYGRGAKVIFTTVGGAFAPRCSDYRGGVHPAIFWINIHSKKPPKQHNTPMTTHRPPFCVRGSPMPSSHFLGLFLRTGLGSQHCTTCANCTECARGDSAKRAECDQGRSVWIGWPLSCFQCSAKQMFQQRPTAHIHRKTPSSVQG